MTTWHKSRLYIYIYIYVDDLFLNLIHPSCMPLTYSRTLKNFYRLTSITIWIIIKLVKDICFVVVRESLKMTIYNFPNIMESSITTASLLHELRSFSIIDSFWIAFALECMIRKRHLDFSWFRSISWNSRCDF